VKPVYWIDTSVLVQSKDRYHTMKRLPQFWEWINSRIEDGSIKMPHAGWRELVAGNDWLAEWCSVREKTDLNCVQDDNVQRVYRELTTEVRTKWANAEHQYRKALKGCDLWVVAFAKHTKGFAVSEENRALRHETHSVKIPDLCTVAKDVRHRDTFAMLDELNAEFGRR
jgi:hypothetical protein